VNIEKNRNADVILFNPAPVTGINFQRRGVLPLSLLHLAGPLEQQGYSVAIIDQFCDPNWEKKFERALESRPICVGVTCMTGPQIKSAVGFCRSMKKEYPDIPIVWGGIHATIKPVQVLDNPWVDIVAIGEGEETLVELVKALEAGHPLDSIKGIGYKDGEDHHFTEARPFCDLNRMPELAYHLVDMDSATENLMGVDHIHLITSRGCIYDCAYCWDPVFHKRKHRAIEAGKVVDQMSRVVKKYGIRGFIFGDDNFFIDLDWAHDVLEKVLDAGLDIHIGKVFIRADTVCRLDKGFIDLMIKAGIRRVVIGAESGNPRILRLIKKRISVDEIIQSNLKLMSYPVRPAYLFMLGLPTETPEEVGDTVKLAERLMKDNPGATRSFNLYTPFPGTELFNKVVEMGYREPERLEDWEKISYRRLPKESPWLFPDTRKLIKILDYALMCHKQDNSLGGIKSADPFSALLAKVYGPAARYRVRSLSTKFPIEPYIIGALRRIIGRDGS
jgi:radical SAM superfamily enzyme YgiQ (UPF0313 family)